MSEKNHDERILKALGQRLIDARRHRAWTAVAFALLACSPTPPAPPSPREAIKFGAPFDRVWNAVIDVFADRNVPIESMDKSSGFISASSQLLLTPTIQAEQAALERADCGKTGSGRPYLANSAKYNVVVRPSGDSTSVRFTIRFVSAAPTLERVIECTSRGKSEEVFEQALREKLSGPGQ